MLALHSMSWRGNPLVFAEQEQGTTLPDACKYGTVGMARKLHEQSDWANTETQNLSQSCTRDSEIFGEGEDTLPRRIDCSFGGIFSSAAVLPLQSCKLYDPVA